jgi:hypothetical protein
MRAVQAALAGLFAALGLVPRHVQTDHGACFLGADTAQRAAVPSRITLWLTGLGIAHRFIPVRRPAHNGAVERVHGALGQSWRGEAGGIEALIAVWNVERPPLAAGHRPYPGRAGFDLGRVWVLLAQTQVRRQVDRAGRISLWNRPVWVSKRLVGQAVTVGFDAARRRVVIRDAHERLVREAELAWLTADWLWEPVALTDQGAHSPDRPTCT